MLVRSARGQISRIEGMLVISMSAARGFLQLETSPDQQHFYDGESRRNLTGKDTPNFSSRGRAPGTSGPRPLLCRPSSGGMVALPPFGSLTKSGALSESWKTETSCLNNVVVDREWPIILTVVFVSSHHRSFPRTMELLTWNSQNHNSLLPPHCGLIEFKKVPFFQSHFVLLKSLRIR